MLLSRRLLLCVPALLKTHLDLSPRAQPVFRARGVGKALGKPRKRALLQHRLEAGGAWPGAANGCPRRVRALAKASHGRTQKAGGEGQPSTASTLHKHPRGREGQSSAGALPPPSPGSVIHCSRSHCTLPILFIQ